MKKLVKLRVNGADCEVAVEPSRTLMDVLRNELGYTGVKQGCDGTGECGTCTVLMDGKPVYSCLLLAVEANGKDILTIEGLGKVEALDPVQEAFIELGALQCGFCTPGIILAAKGFLDENPNPAREEVVSALSGNLCRCTGYVKIVDAVMLAAEKRRR